MVYLRRKNGRIRAVTNSEILRNKRALEHAVAQQKLEGLSMSAEAIADLERVAAGQRTTADVIANLYTRYAHVPVLQP